MIKREVLDLIRALGMMWPTVPVRDFDAEIQCEIWATVLFDVSYDEAVAVAVEHARTGVAFPPSVGAIAERVITLREHTSGTYAPDPDQALAEVMAGVRHGGIGLIDPKRKPPHRWSHPAVAATVRAMGWRDICMSENPDVVRAQFLRIYANARARLVAQQRRSPQMAALLARPELPTTTTGEPNDEPDEPDRHPVLSPRTIGTASGGGPDPKPSRSPRSSAG